MEISGRDQIDKNALHQASEGHLRDARQRRFGGLVHMFLLTVMVLAMALSVQPRQAQAAEIYGIDVSKWQGTINWTKVKKSGIEFVMIGTGRYKNGVATADSMFETNIEGALSAGISVGVYHYATATTVSDMQGAAEYVLNLVDGYEISYPIAIDIEDSVYSSMTKTKRTKLVQAFVEVIADAGYYPMIYASDTYFQKNLNLVTLAGYDYWVAYWTSNHGDTMPTTTPLSMWQYNVGDAGTVKGITTRIDLDLSYKDYTQIITPRTTAVARRTTEGWQTDGENYWYIQADGTTATSTWLTVNYKKYYVDENGYRLTGLQYLDGNYYYFNKSTGVMRTGWVTISKKTYYFDGDTGIRQTGWITVNGSVYYLDPETAVRKTGWLTIGDNTYYLRKKTDPAGQRASGWTKISGKYYYFDKKTGVMQTGWITVGSSKYYLDPNTGVRKTGWLTINNKKYYLRSNGKMVTGWKKIKGKYYYFSKKGVMQKNKKIGKYKLNAKGVCTNR
ncbi:MAG: hypothetical protein LUI13_00480 [Lachnospiraceae bacterium]|nr:hypothetical protein [Lachnospiraceae bacterium]